MNMCLGNISRHPSRLARRSALTLIEMMVSITLLAVIMIGLLAMFQHTQKALRVAYTQTDVFENARAAIDLVARDLSEMTAYGDSNIFHTRFTRYASPVTELVVPSGSNQLLYMNEVFWMSRVNDDWKGIGYYVTEDPAYKNNLGVATLYRYSDSTNRVGAPGLFDVFSTTPNTHRVSDGIVHFALDAGYVTGTNSFGQTVYDRASNLSFVGDELPAFVDIEIGVLEPATLKQFQALASLNTAPAIAAAQSFLTNHVGRIHFFRERVPIRNFVNPYRENEVP